MADWKLRARVFVQRITRPTCTCMLAMTAPSFAALLLSLPHWKIALQTGVGTGLLAVLLSFTPIARVLANRYGNALARNILTTLADAWSHPGRFQVEYTVGNPDRDRVGPDRARDVLRDRAPGASRAQRLGEGPQTTRVPRRLTLP